MQKLFITIFLFSALSISSCSNKSNSGDKNNLSIKERGTQLLSSNPKDLIVYTDSLLKKNSNKLDNETLILVYELKQKAYSSLKKMDSVLITGEKIREIASKIPDSLAIANSLLLVKGDIEFKEQKKLLVYLPSAINTFNKLKMPFEEARLLSNYGAILVQSGDFKLAQSQLLRAYDMMEKLDSIKHLTNISVYIGNNYQRLKSNDLALKYYNKALALAKQSKDTMTQVSILMNLGIFYGHIEGKTDSTIIFYQMAKQLFPKNGPYYLGMKLDYNMASESYKRKKYSEAEAIFVDMQAKCVQKNLLEGYAHALSGISQVYAETNRLPNSIITSKKAFQLFDSLGLKYDAQSEASNLAGIYAKAGNGKDAINTMNLAQKLKDSLMSVEKQKAVLELESKYQAEKKENEIVLLKKDVSYRQNVIIILIIVATVFFLLYRKLKRINYELDISRNVLVEQYRQEKLVRDAESDSDKAQIALLKAKALVEPKVQEEISLINALEQYFNDEKPYLDSKLKEEDVLTHLNTNAKSLVRILKENGFDNFNGLLNYYRVNEAKLLMEAPENYNLKIEVIANLAGFGSRQSFYNAFETHTGLSPAYYRNKLSTIPN